MNKFTLTLATAAMLLCGTGVSNAFSPKDSFDISKLAYKGKHHSELFDSERMQQVNSANAVLEAGKPSRFANALTDNGDNSITPNHEFLSKDLQGDIDGPDGSLWFYSGTIEYETIVHNEYFTEQLPKSFKLTLYDSNMNVMGDIQDTFVLKEDESRVREVEVVPTVSRNYFNSDDKCEIMISVLVNPVYYGIRPYTYVYSLGNPKDENGDDTPVKTINGLISNVLNASDANGENIFLTFINEGNDSGISEDELQDTDKYWPYQLGHHLQVESYSKADANGNLQKVFDKRIIYYQSQGNQQDDPTLLTYVHNGKPVILFPYYEDVFYNQFNSMNEDMTQRIPNNLIIEIYEMDDVSTGFQLKQTTKIPVVIAPDEDVLASYYGIGSFSYTDDVIYGDDGKASFIITRRDYIPSTDGERLSYHIYGPDGSMKQPLFENSLSHLRLADIEGFDPQELFISSDGQDGYWFNFVNMRTLATELKLHYGLTIEGSDEPDYIMANLERTKVGDSYMYVAEMRYPEYDDINELTYMRIVWLTREGQVDHIDYVNMGNRVNYAALNLTSYSLDENYYYEDPAHEYMMLIKRGFGDSTAAQEQLLVSQATSEENPTGKQLLLLGPDEQLGNLKHIAPFANPNRLAVTYMIEGDGRNIYSTHYYDLPFNKTSGIADAIGSDAPFSFDGATVSLAGELIEVYNLQGIRVASATDAVSLDGMTPGVYLVRAAGHTGKVVVK